MQVLNSQKLCFSTDMLQNRERRTAIFGDDVVICQSCKGNNQCVFTRTHSSAFFTHKCNDTTMAQRSSFPCNHDLTV